MVDGHVDHPLMEVANDGYTLVTATVIRSTRTNNGIEMKLEWSDGFVEYTTTPTGGMQIEDGFYVQGGN